MFCAGVTQMRELQPGSCALAWARFTLKTTLTSLSAERLAELQRQLSSIQQQQEKLLNMRLADEIDGEVFSRKSVELRDRAARLVLKIVFLRIDSQLQFDAHHYFCTERPFPASQKKDPTNRQAS